MSIAETFSAAEMDYRRERITSDFMQTRRAGSFRRTLRLRRRFRPLSGGAYRPAGARG